MKRIRTIARWLALMVFGHPCFAQQYELRLMPDVNRVTALGGTTAYGDLTLAPTAINIWRGSGTSMAVTGGYPSVVYDSDGRFAVGYSADMASMTSEALMWTPDGNVTVCDRTGWRHACILGAGGGAYVGRVIDGPSVRAARWDSEGALTVIHPSGYSWSLAEDASSTGVIVGVADDTGVVWTGIRTVYALPSPAWASVQSWPHAINADGIVVGEASSKDRTRPVAWIGGEPVNIADCLGVALDINDSGVAVGWAGDGLSSFGAVWSLPASCEPVDLNTLVDHRGLSIVAAYAISQSGNIGVQCNVGGQSVGGVLVRKTAKVR